MEGSELVNDQWPSGEDDAGCYYHHQCHQCHQCHHVTLHLLLVVSYLIVGYSSWHRHLYFFSLPHHHHHWMIHHTDLCLSLCLSHDLLVFPLSLPSLRYYHCLLQMTTPLLNVPVDHYDHCHDYCSCYGYYNSAHFHHPHYQTPHHYSFYYHCYHLL